jgi:hypothetical protein
MTRIFRIMMFLTTCLCSQFAFSSPTISSFSPASGQVGALITIKGSGLLDPSALSINGIAALLISNADTQLVAFVMPGTTTGNISVTTAGGSTSSSGSFTIVGNTLPNTQQGNKLIGTGAVNAAAQGVSVAMSADGNTVISGGNQDSSSLGAAWVFARNNGVWSQQGNKLVGSGAGVFIGNIAQIGTSVAMSADGNTAAIGGPGYGGVSSNQDTGAVWVFTRNNGIWTQQGEKLIGSPVAGSVGSAQGGSIAISADGNTIVSSGAQDNAFTGAIWTFKRSSGVWAQSGNKLVIASTSIALSADGNTLLVGNSSALGSATVFVWAGSSWTQQGSPLIGTGTTNNNTHQGSSVAIGADGSTAIIFGGNDYPEGAAWVFVRSSGTWSQQGNKLVGTGGITGGSSSSAGAVSISADGNTAIVTKQNDNSSVGAAWIFTRNNGVWSQQGSKLIGSGYTNNGIFPPSEGKSVSLSADGNNFIMGGFNDDYTTINASDGIGASWIFYASGSLPLTLLSFTTEMQNNESLLRWQTTNEVNTAYFTIEKSNDGQNFSPIGKVNALSNGPYENSYNFDDKHPDNINYYRLLMTDKDGKFTYSNVIKDILTLSTGTIKVFPNPVSSFITINGNMGQTGAVNIVIADATGRTVFKATFATATADFTTNISVEKLLPGVYNLTVIQNDSRKITSFLKQ